MTTGVDVSSKEAAIRHALRGVIDPEIGLSVVDVGLIYSIDVDDDGNACIRMTTTSRGCPAAQFLIDAVCERARDTGVVSKVEVG
jgi:metal-sulfur cluster biosynthetic enzyme